ncbi:uncharacterized protein LOC106667310 isoform X2 [Cimex lectularius]|uniref:Helicase ARIP4 n=1 Tax=Cimex lectularius TaxID=79782 RepID=A0A8I6RSF9_CIMLE|nr:uncharacterized protein LOC106667310 isoform X2 [Cimex lectularius]
MDRYVTRIGDVTIQRVVPKDDMAPESHTGLEDEEEEEDDVEEEDEEEDGEAYKADDPVQDGANPSDQVENMDESIPCHESADIDGVPVEEHEVLESLENASGEVASVMDSSELLRNIKEEPMEQDMAQDPTSEEDSTAKDHDEKEVPEHDDESTKRKQDSDLESEVGLKKKKQDEDNETDKKKALNMRRNIREVMDENQLDEATLAAQRQEMERLRRVQDQQKYLRDVQRQMQINRQNHKTQSRVISLLQGNTSMSVLKGKSAAFGAQASVPVKPSGSVSLVKLGSDAPPQVLDKKVLDAIRGDRSQSPPSNTKPGLMRTLGSKHMVTPSVTIAPVKSTPFAKEKKDVVTISSSDDDEERGEAREERPSEAVTRLSDDDDCIVLSDPSDDEEEADVDPTNSGMHTNDLFNTPDEQGRVLINVGKQEGEPEIFLAPQIARIIKPHQIGGVRFLFDNVVESVERFKNSTGFGCILAHSMGLGKTLQVVSFCDVFLRETTARTVMCIMPINTLQNWVAEFNIWLPMDATNSPLAAQGEVRTRDFRIFVLNDFHKTIVSRSKVVAEWQREGGVLLIGYEMYRQLSLKRSGRVRKGKKRPPDEDMEDEKNKPLIEQMHDALVKPGPDLVICDEGHRIKNSHASISHALKQIRTKRRIVLTGYPLQNNLLEYWCMVDFVRPNYLGTKTEFSNMFERPIQNGQCIDSTPQDIRLMRYRAHVLHSLLEGFVQRRSHSVLRNTLPQKEEYVLLVRMTPFQRKLYDTFMNEVVRTKAVPNPLKAFAVCCKIWNHPDILYNFLKKREMDELQDLDIDETAVMAQRAAGQEAAQPTLSPRGRKSDKKGKGGKKAQAVAVPMKSPVVAAVPPTTSQSQVEVKTEESNTFDGFNYYQQYNNNSRNFEQPPTSSAPTSSNYNYQNYNYNYNNYNYNESNYNYNNEYNYNNNYYQQQQQQQQSPQGQGYNYNYQGRQVKTEPGTEIDFKNIKKEEKKEDVLKQTFCRGLSGGEVVFNQSSYQNQYEERAPFQGGFDFNQFGQNFGSRNQSSFNWNQEYDEFQGDKKKSPGKKASQEKKDSFMQDEYYRNDAFSGDYCTDKKRENQVGMNFDTGLMGQQREMQQNFGYQKDEIKCNQRGQYEQDMMQNPVNEQNQDMQNVQMMGSGLNMPGNSGMQNHSAYQQASGYQGSQNQIDMQNMAVHKHNQIGYGNQQQPAPAQVQHLPANNPTVQNQMLDQTGSQNSTSQGGHQMAHHQASPGSQMHMGHHQINSTQGLAQNIHHQGVPINGANTQNQVQIHQAVQGTPNQSVQAHQNVHMMNTTVNTPNQMMHQNMPDSSGQVMQMHQNMPISGNTLNQTVQMHQNMPMSGNAPNQSMQMNMLSNNQGMPMTSSASVPPNQNVLAHQSIPMTSNPTNQGMQMQQNNSSTAITPNQSMQIHVNMPSNNQGMQLHQNMSNQGMHIHESMPMSANALNQNVPMNANQSNVLNQIGNQSLQMQAMVPNSNPNNQTLMHQSGNLPGQSMLHQNGNNTSGQNMQMHQGMPITSSASIAPNQIMHMHQSVPVNNTPSNQNMQMHQSMPANNNPNNQGVPMTSSASIAPNQGMLMHQSLSTNNQGMQIHQSMPMTSNASITPNQSMQMHQNVPMNTSSNNQSMQMHQNMPMTSSSSVAPNQSIQMHQSVPMNTNSNNQSMQMHQNMPMTSSSSVAPNQSMQMHQSVPMNTSSNSQGMQMATSGSVGPNQSMQMHQSPMGAPNQGLQFHQNPTNQLNQGMPLHASHQQNVPQGLAQTNQQSQGTQMTQKADGGTKPDGYHDSYQVDYQAENDKRRGDFYHQGQYYNQNFPDFANFQNSYSYGPQAGPSGLGKTEQKEKRGMSCQTDPIDKDDKVPYDKAETEKRLFEQWDKEEGGKTKDDGAPSKDKKEEESPKKLEAAPPVHKPAKEEPGIPYDWATELLKGYVPGDINSSAKMAVFFCILEESIALGDRILLFSQSLFTLNLIEELLQQQQVYGKTEKWAKNINYYRLDGSTTAIEREKLINEFNSNPNLHLFLVSTRAGSLGINLVGANRVIVFDASWNPCHDTQAVCRVYRYGQKKPCFVYRLVTDNCLEKKIYDRQINKQGMSDRVVDECNPDAHLSIKEVTSLCWDDKEDETLRDFTDLQDSYIDVVIQKVLQKHSSLLSKEPFQHESLLVDRKEKKLSQAEKRLAKRSYELEKQASTSTSRPPYYNNPVNSQGAIIRGPDKPMASVRPMQSELSSQLVRDGGPRQRGWIPASVWQRQGMSAQEMTLPLDVVIPTNAPDRSSIVLKAGQKVMVLKSPKGIYMQLENGKIIAIRTAFKVKDKEQQQQQLQPKKGLDVRGRGSLPNLRNNNVTITPTRPSPHRPHRPVRAVGPVTRPPVTVTVTRKRPVGIPGVPEAPTVLEESGDSDEDGSPAARGKEYPAQPVSGAPFPDVFRPATSGSGTSFDPPPDYPAPPYDQRPDEMKGQEKGFQPYYYPPTSNYYKPYEYPGPNPFTAAAVASSRNFDPYYPTPYYPPFMSSQYMNTAGQPPSQPPPPQ